MKTQKLLLLVLFAILSLSSCKYECPCFDKSLLVWMPQEYGNTIQFTNQDKSDTLTFYVTKKYYSDSYKIERQNRQSCYADAELITRNDTDSLFYSLQISSDYNNTSSIVSEISVKQALGSFGINNINSQEYILNNKSYKSLFLESDTTKTNDGIYKIILAENYGLLQIYEKTGEVWTLIEK